VSVLVPFYDHSWTCAIELPYGVLSRAMIIERPAHNISKYAADFRGLLVVSCYAREDHTLPANISAAPLFFDGRITFLDEYVSMFVLRW
jgi:hypothetical protein